MKKSNSCNSIRNELLQINKDISALFSDDKIIPGIADNYVVEWKETCENLRKRLKEDIIRIAVVGPIKSGKSTFLNSLLNGDYLKRGAGVVTSIVTRIQKGKSLKAKLFFKALDEVNSEIDQALVMFPKNNLYSKGDGFDIRQETDRTSLQETFDTLSTDQLITDGIRNANSVLISSYLKGYDSVKEYLSSDVMTKEYKGKLFQEHKNFVGNEVLAVYLKDILLKIDSAAIGSNIEIADCQGSDSSNPLHIAMIQDYLLLTHLIIYVVSSRTGLRQADIRFLSMIRNMGIMDNFLFVFNCDFSEHESIENLKSLVKKVKEELSLIKPGQEIFSFSALYNLFKTINKNLPEKDRLRFEQWQKETRLVDFSDSETGKFKSSFTYMLSKRRYSLLLKNHVERHSIILSDIHRWVGITQGLLERETNDAAEIINMIKHHQARMDQIKSMINSTLSGAVPAIRHELNIDVNRFFDARSGQVLGEIIRFIKNYKVYYRKYEESLKGSGFLNTLYLVFQEFKQSIDTSVVETVNPEVIRFARDMEKKIHDHFQSIFGAYEATVEDAFIEYESILKNLNMPYRIQENHRQISFPEMDSIKETSGLKIPTVVAFMRYSAKIKAEAFIYLWFYTAVRTLKKILKKTTQKKETDEFEALKSGIRRMKRETEKSIIFHFQGYRENIKFKYLFKLVDFVSSTLQQTLINRFQDYVTDLSRLVDKINNNKIDKQRTFEILKEVDRNLREINKKIISIKKRIDMTK